MLSDRVKSRALEIIEYNLVNPWVKDDARAKMPKAILKTCGMKLDNDTLVVAQLWQKRGDGLTWKIWVSFRYDRLFDPEKAFTACGLFLKPGELDKSKIVFSDGMPAVDIYAPYIPEIEELREYEALTRVLGDDETVTLH